LASLILPFLEYEIATPLLREARNDKVGKRRDSHGFPKGSLAITKFISPPTPRD
jgi:hypothetical protein